MYSIPFPLQQRLIKILALLLACAAAIYLVRGLYVSMSEPGSYDLRMRALEYRLFSQRVYPSNFVASNALPGETLPNSVYPPYAFPLFAPVFAFGDGLAMAVAFGLLNVAGMLAIAAFGYRELRFAGWHAGCLGAVAGLAIAHNSSVLALGQFSIICMGLVVLQLRSLGRGQVAWAGVFWALAMVKPQIGLVFALPFLVQRRWRVGLLLGLGLLAALSVYACYYTRVAPAMLIEYWLLREDYSFITGGDSMGSSTGSLLAAWGMHPRVALVLSLGAALFIGFWSWVRMRRRQLSILVLVAVCAIVGRVFMPHRAYDNIMLFPALIAVLGIAIERRTPLSYAMAAAFGLSLWIPLTSLVRTAVMDGLVLLIWLVAAVYLMLAPGGVDRSQSLLRTS